MVLGTVLVLETTVAAMVAARANGDIFINIHPKIELEDVLESSWGASNRDNKGSTLLPVAEAGGSGAYGDSRNLGLGGRSTVAEATGAISIQPNGLGVHMRGLSDPS